ncbi:MAG TPA: type IV pilus modification protein PilV [Lysobacter sp.]
MNLSQRRQPSAPRGQQRGMSLLEVLIAVLVLAIGLLGVAALQATALRNSQSSLERNQAVIASYTILDAMRANLVSARAGNYALARTCTVPTAAGTPADVLRDADQQDWIRDMQAVMGGSACGLIEFSGGVYTITVEWDDSRGSGGSNAQKLKTMVQI